MRLWDTYVDEADRSVLEAGGFGRDRGAGLHPALLIVDVTYGFAGDEPGDHPEQLHQYPTYCGPSGWPAVAEMERLTAKARARRLPIFYTVIDPGLASRDVAVKGEVLNAPALRLGAKGADIVAPLAPREGEVVLTKLKPSAFFGTPLASLLVQRGVDTLIVVGCTTSGCVRATVVDAFSNNFRAIVPEEAVFDRGRTSHAVSLFDMHQKYADVVPVSDVLTVLDAVDVRYGEGIVG